MCSYVHRCHLHSMKQSTLIANIMRAYYSKILSGASLPTSPFSFHSIQKAPSNSKIIHLVRHAEGTHNVEKKYKAEEHLDAPLTNVGIKQCTTFSEEIATKLNNIECIVTSPMTRAIQTAQFCFDDHINNGQVPFVACEEWRETVNYLCDVRRETSYLRDEFPKLNFEHIQHETDPIWDYYKAIYGTQDDFGQLRELADLDSLKVRCRAALDFIIKREEKEIAIVSHSALFYHLFNSFDDSLVKFEDDAVESLMKDRFENCEVRSIAIQVN